MAGLTLPDTFLTLDARLRHDRVSLDELVRIYRALYADEGVALVEPYAGVGAALRELHDGGEKCIVVSNKGITAVRRSLAQNGNAAFVDLVFADEPGLPKKPDPAIIVEHVLPRYPQLLREQILMVGDTETDILFAKRTGMASCWVSYGYGEAQRCRKLAPDFEIASLSELPALVLAR
jgi:phosphoglycolate phosphatase